VWAVGGTGNAVALHFDGASWQPATDAVLADHSGLAGVAVDGDGTVVMVGSNGTKLRGRPGHLVDESELVRVEADLHSTAIAKGEAYAVGGNYIAPAPTPRHGVVAHYGAPISATLR
jgi:hypothetical protein